MFRRERNLLLAVDDEADFLELIEQIGVGIGCDVTRSDGNHRDFSISRGAFRECLRRPGQRASQPPSTGMIVPCT